jgi:histidinol phosphatase-like enzyme
MIEIACRDHSINPTTSTLIGDADRDIEMARNGLIGTSIRITNSRPDTSSPTFRTPSLPIALSWLQSRHPA